MVVSDVERTAFAPTPAAIEEYGLVLQNRSFAYVFFWYFLSFTWFPWPVVYSAVGSRTPICYADVRQFALEFAALVRDGATVSVDVEGRDVETGERRSVAGTVRDVDYGSGNSQTHESDLLGVVGTTTLVVDDGGESVAIGGWNAVYEDVEAESITVTEVEH